MKHRISIAVATAFALSGCVLPFPTTTLPTKALTPAKVDKVQTMTRTFSLTKNQGLNKATQSVQQLANALKSAFMAGASAMPSSRRYATEDAFHDVRKAGMRAAYTLSGVAEQGDARLIYDDATGEVTAIESANARVEFKFVNEGAHRVWEAVIVKSPDGTTGKFHIEVTGTWGQGMSFVSGPVMAGPTPVRPTMPKPAPRAVMQADLVGPTADEAMPTDDDAPEPTLVSNNDEQAPMPEFTPPPPPPYKWLNNELPQTVDTVSFSLDVTPKGDPSIALKASGTLDEPATLPNSSLQVPSHWVYNVALPKVSFDWESNLSLALNKSTFKAHGALNVDTDNGKEQFTYEAKADEAKRAMSFALTNTGAKVTLLLAAQQSSPTRQPDVKTTLVSSEDGTKLGDVALDPKRPRYAIVTFTDGSKMDWELYPEGLFPQAPPSEPIAQADFDAIAQN